MIGQLFLTPTVPIVVSINTITSPLLWQGRRREFFQSLDLLALQNSQDLRSANAEAHLYNESWLSLLLIVLILTFNSSQDLTG